MIHGALFLPLSWNGLVRRGSKKETPLFPEAASGCDGEWSWDSGDTSLPVCCASRTWLPGTR